MAVMCFSLKGSKRFDTVVDFRHTLLSLARVLLENLELDYLRVTINGDKIYDLKEKD